MGTDTLPLILGLISITLKLPFLSFIQSKSYNQDKLNEETKKVEEDMRKSNELKEDNEIKSVEMNRCNDEA